MCKPQRQICTEPTYIDTNVCENSSLTAAVRSQADQRAPVMGRQLSLLTHLQIKYTHICLMHGGGSGGEPPWPQSICSTHSACSLNLGRGRQTLMHPPSPPDTRLLGSLLLSCSASILLLLLHYSVILTPILQAPCLPHSSTPPFSKNLHQPILSF